MKKNFLLLAILFALTVKITSAQTRCSKGTWICGLNPISYSVFNKGKSTQYTGDTIISKHSGSTNGFSVRYNIGAGYFLKDNFCIGTGFGTGGAGSAGSPFFSTELFARYYLLQRNRCFSFVQENNTRKYAFFIQGVVLGHYYKTSDKTNSNYPLSNVTVTNKVDRIIYLYGIQAAGGYTHILSKHVALEFITVYNISKSGSTEKKANIYEKYPITRSTGMNNALLMFLGIQTYF